MSDLDPAIAARLRRTAAGLVAAVVQERATGQVLMLGWMDDEALHRTLTTGRATYWSRSRERYWVKGETSGHHQYVREVVLDCDGDALLLVVDQIGPACHTGSQSCFSERLPVTATGSPQRRAVDPEAVDRTAVESDAWEPGVVPDEAVDGADAAPGRLRPRAGEPPAGEGTVGR